jgi:hypothetical protein
MTGLDVEKSLVTAHDVAGAGSNCGLQEFVIIRIAANGLGKRDRLNDLRVELDNLARERELDRLSSSSPIRPIYCTKNSPLPAAPLL